MHDLSVEGDDDRWMVLERNSAEGLPLIARSRINPVVSEFADQNQLSAVIFDVRAHLVCDNGMPRCMDELYELEDAIILHLTSCDVAVYHTASVTGDGQRVLYFAHGEGLDFSPVIAATSHEVALMNLHADIDFAGYRALVTPSALDHTTDGDRRMIAQLQESGDDGSAPRKVDFWFHGGGEGLDKLARVLSGMGFAIDHWIEEPAGVVMSVEVPADQTSFRELTPLLIAAAADCGVEYEGWETFVVTGNPEAHTPRPGGTLLDGLFGQRKH
jgi:hypothetical protein